MNKEEKQAVFESCCCAILCILAMFIAADFAAGIVAGIGINKNWGLGITLVFSFLIFRFFKWAAGK